MAEKAKAEKATEDAVVEASPYENGGDNPQVASKDRKVREAAGCYMLDGAVEVVHDAKKGYVLVATNPLPAGKVVLVEQAYIADEPPRYLHPRRPEDVPPCFLGCPLFVCPRWIFRKFAHVMHFLRLYVNCCEPSDHLYVFGSVCSHACRPSAIRATREDGLSAIVMANPVASGEEISLTYVTGLGPQPTWIRRIVLFFRYGFWCRCHDCNKGTGKDREDTLKKAMDKALENTAKILKNLPSMMADNGNRDYPKVTLKDSSNVRDRYWSLFMFMSSVPILFVPLAIWSVKKM